VDRLRPPLSSVRFPHYQLGTEAAALLIERIEAQDSPVKILFLAPELVARGSTVPLASVPETGNAVPLRRSGRGRA
jgi:LacI family transcriptional regulator